MTDIIKQIFTVRVMINIATEELEFYVTKHSDYTYSDISKHLTRQIIKSSNESKYLESQSKKLMEIRGLIDKL